jgi:hypothetical protein
VNGAETIPCDVQTVLQAKCWSCHGTDALFGAPLLMSPAAFRATAKKDPTRTVGALAAVRVQDPTQLMPPSGYPGLSPAEVAVIQNWASRGNAAGPACSVPQGTGGVSSAGTGGTPSGFGGTTGTGGILTGSGGAIGSGGTIGGAGGTIGGTGGTPTGTGAAPAGTGGTVGVPGEVTCYKIVARQDAANAAFSVPTTPDTYINFSYALPWGTKKVHIVSARELIDNSKVIHHWLLYNTAAAGTEGLSTPSIGAHPDASLIVGWAPGNSPPVLPDDVGLGIPGAGFALEVHYNNTQPTPQADRSGVEVCVTEKLRKNEAQISWLGTQNLNKLQASGTCKPNLTGPVTILFSWPHEHLQGRHLKTVITRVNGTQETLIDKPFDFNSQIVYPTPAVINPGDSLTTTCTYAQPVGFGQGTNAEMCYNFITAYPGGAITQGLSALRINDCTN